MGGEALRFPCATPLPIRDCVTSSSLRQLYGSAAIRALARPHHMSLRRQTTHQGLGALTLSSCQTTNVHFIGKDHKSIYSPCWRIHASIKVEVMSKIVKLKIRNFRGIREFDERFSSNFVCLIGRGDSGKTTILDSIAAVLSSSWNLTFYDTDFHQCDIENPIELSVSLIDFPAELLLDNKYGMHSRFLNPQNGEIVDTVESGFLNVLTIKLCVNSTLEPKWVVTNNREHEDKSISAADRAKLNCFMVSDYVDRHFSWNKGNPLYSILKAKDATPDEENTNVVLNAFREAKASIDEDKFDSLSGIEEDIKSNAAAFGLDISRTHTTMDFRDLAIKDGRVCLHDDQIPFRLKGKGSKRLSSMAIQSILTQAGGIMLVDEIEQGLEPDRVRLLARTLKEENVGQIFITTHSREVVTELEASDLVVLNKDKDSCDMKVTSLTFAEGDLQKVVRACPEAFFAKKVIVCEGATELGICRALDKHRKTQGKETMSFRDAAYIDGTGSEFVNRAFQINATDIQVSMLGDSDDPGFNSKKEELRLDGIAIFDCDDNCAIEDQVFIDLPWVNVLELLDYAAFAHSKTVEEIEGVIAQNYGGGILPDDWRDTETLELRKALAGASQDKHKAREEKRKGWFKRIDHGEKLGELVFRNIDEMDNEKRLKTMLSELSDWIDA